MKNLNYIETYAYNSNQPWLHLIVFWAIHWNETCWTNAINKVIEKINSNKLKLYTWKITLIPVCNPKAYKHKKRYIDKNLNRVFRKTKNPKFYEEIIANKIIDHFDEADVLLDIHSSHSKDWPFTFFDFNNELNLKLVKSLKLKNIITWWQKAYKNTFDTQKYWNKYNKYWVTIECWNHDDPNSIKIAENAIYNIMKTLKIIKWKHSELKNYNYINLEKIIVKKFDWYFPKNWKNLDKVNKWEIIWVYNNWKNIIMPYDWYILLPYSDAKIWEEWFYLWKKHNKIS